MVFASITRISSNHTANILKIPFPSKPNDNNHTFRPFFLQKRVSPSRESHRSLRVSTGFSSLFFPAILSLPFSPSPCPMVFPLGCLCPMLLMNFARRRQENFMRCLAHLNHHFPFYIIKITY